MEYIKNDDIFGMVLAYDFQEYSYAKLIGYPKGLLESESSIMQSTGKKIRAVSLQ